MEARFVNFLVFLTKFTTKATHRRKGSLSSWTEGTSRPSWQGRRGRKRMRQAVFSHLHQGNRDVNANIQLPYPLFLVQNPAPRWVFPRQLKQSRNSLKEFCQRVAVKVFLAPVTLRGLIMAAPHFPFEGQYPLLHTRWV